MIKRYSQRREAKCNFCFNWFSTTCNLKNSIHLCPQCLDRALHTSCFRLTSPDGKDDYQLYLFRSNVRVCEGEGPNDQQNLHKLSLIESIDQYRHQQLRLLDQKWTQIAESLNSMPHFRQREVAEYANMLRESIKNYPTAAQVLANQKNEEKAGQAGPSRAQSPKQIKIESPEDKNQQGHLYSSAFRPALRQLMNSPKKDVNTSQFDKQPSMKLVLPSQRKSARVKTARNQGQAESRNLVRSPSKGNLKPKRKQTVPALSRQQRERDLKLVAQNALKARIYSYLQSESSISPALYLPTTFSTYDALQNTSTLNSCIELVSFDLQQIDILCYLTMLEWGRMEVLKLVKVGLDDEQFRTVLHFLRGRNIETLVATSNKLTESSVIELQKEMPRLPALRNVYLGRNRIQKMKIKQQLRQVEGKITLYL